MLNQNNRKKLKSRSRRKLLFRQNESADFLARLGFVLATFWKSSVDSFEEIEVNEESNEPDNEL